MIRLAIKKLIVLPFVVVGLFVGGLCLSAATDTDKAYAANSCIDSEGNERCSEWSVGVVKVPKISSCKVKYSWIVNEYSSGTTEGECKDHLNARSYQIGQGLTDFVLCDVPGYADYSTTCTIQLSTGETATVGNNERFNIDLNKYPIKPYFAPSGDYEVAGSAMRCPENHVGNCMVTVILSSNTPDRYAVEPGGGALIGPADKVAANYQPPSGYSQGDDGKAAVIQVYSKAQADNDNSDVIIAGAEGESGADTTEEESTCNIGSSLGWLICPVVEFMGGLIDDIYTWMEENFLIIKASFVDTASNNGTYIAWQKFRDMANVAFVIFLLVVIFSQVTGLGISNYGIKKILPKLIAVALLVNLSYFICQIAVDLSNIVGNQIKSLFDAVARSVSGTSDFVSWTKGTVEGRAGGIILTVLAGVGVVAGMVAFGAVGGLLMLLLGALLSIIMAFVILIVRQAAVILLVAIAPVAFICYMLPNTEKYFKKWLDILKAMLLIYPILGAVMGAGRLAGVTIQAADDGIMFLMIGAACTVLPFFALPSLIKNSMAAMGALGSKIAGLGNLGKGMRTKGISRMKSAPGNSQFGRGIKSRVGKGLAAGGRLMSRSRAGRVLGGRALMNTGAGLASSLDKSQAEDTAAYKAMYSNMGADKISEDLTRHINNGDVAGMNAAIDQLASTGQFSSIQKSLGSANGVGNDKTAKALQTALAGNSTIKKEAAHL
ncbi:MAG: type IV secretion system protein, partial [Candidatus Nomurabacteria bacterium]|nr:type IV secretion system protein [Candidatus Nomurabacteria bacterium]